MNVRTRVLTKFESPQLGSCKYRCAYINLVVGTSVSSAFTLWGLFSFFYFLFFARTNLSSFLCPHKKHKNANKRISGFFPLDVFYAHKNDAFFVFVCLYAFLCLTRMYDFNLIYKSSYSLIVSTHILTKRRM